MFGTFITSGVWLNRIGKEIGKTMKNMMKIVLKWTFSSPGEKLTEVAREEWKLQGWGIVVSIFEMDQNWSQLDPGKTFYILKTIFQNFYYLVIRMRQFLRWVMSFAEYISW